MYPLQHVMEEDRMRFTGVRAPQEDDVRFLDLPIRTRPSTSTENRRQPGDARCVSRPVATVDVVTTYHHAGELLRHEVRFIARFGTAKQPERLWSAPGTRGLEALHSPC
jgi:hypothetical protein